MSYYSAAYSNHNTIHRVTFIIISSYQTHVTKYIYFRQMVLISPYF